MLKIITKEDLFSKIKELLKEFELIGPRELSNKGIFYQQIMKINDLYLGDAFTIEPIKKSFLDPSEWLFQEHFKQGSELLEEIPLSKNKRIIIGIRPCEAKGLTLLDKVFDPSINSGSTLSKVEGVDSEFKDSFYINNRKRTIIIGLACNKPDRNCFCTSMGGSPVESRGMDVIIFTTEGSPERSRGKTGERFITEIITGKGKEIFNSLGEELNEEMAKSLALDNEKRKSLLERKIKVPESLDSVFESAYWEKVSFPCVSCGICTYLCPTCHCFDLIDEQRKCLRCYDGCSFPDFTLQASGENPRPTKKERYRQRVFHKFDYFKKNFGENLCVGCGRCIRHCPVKIDIADIVDKIPC